MAPAGTLLVQRLSERIAGRVAAGPAACRASLPALALSLALVSFALTCAGNALSRPVEARADAFALELTDDPKAFIELERSLTLRNLGDPDPPTVLHTAAGHPPDHHRPDWVRGDLRALTAAPDARQAVSVGAMAALLPPCVLAWRPPELAV